VLTADAELKVRLRGSAQLAGSPYKSADTFLINGLERIIGKYLPLAVKVFRQEQTLVMVTKR